MAVLRKIHKFLKHSGMPPTQFGRLAVNDPRLVGDLRNGREPGERTVRRIEAFLATQPQWKPRRPGRPRRGDAR